MTGIGDEVRLRNLEVWRQMSMTRQQEYAVVV
jgi:hypothetical protein